VSSDAEFGVMRRPGWDASAYEAGAEFQRSEGALLVAALGDLTGQRVLDVGCGDGRVTALVEEAGADVTGVDPSASMLAAAAARGLRVVAGRAEDLPFAARAFDLVISNAALHWTLDHERVVAELCRVVRAGGRLRVRTGGPGNQWRLFVEAERRFATTPYAMFRPRGFRAPLRMADPALWAAALLDGGLRVERIDVETVEPPWHSAAEMETWFTPIAHPYTCHVPPELAARFVADVVEALWPLPRRDRAFVRLVVDAARPEGERVDTTRRNG
jgi:trans-aconitate 2-methyltransferase